MAHGAQPVALLGRRKSDIGLRPAFGPEVLVAVEAGRSHPVLQRKIVTVPDAEPALLGGVHQEQAAERPERLAAQALLALLVDYDDMLAGIGDFGRGDEAGEAGADHDYVSLVGHGVTPGFLRMEDRRPKRGQRQMALACGRGASFGDINLFQFGTLRRPGAARAQHLI
jgi:hypothetical protein